MPSEQERILDKYLPTMVNCGIIFEPKPGVYQITNKFREQVLETAMLIQHNHKITSQISGNPLEVANEVHNIAIMQVAVEYLGDYVKENDLVYISTILYTIKDIGLSGV